jgi:hypothetical protein
MSDFLDEVKRDVEQAKAIPKDEQLSLLSSKAQRQIELEDEVESLESRLKETKAALAKVSELEIPELMGQLGVKEFTLTVGLKVKVAPFYAAKIPEEKSEQAFDWLEDNDHAGIIKGEFVVMYRRPDKQRIGQFLDLARELGFDTKDKLAVHPQTLKAFVREQIEGGTEDFPRELFGVYTGWKTKISKK